jgi:hypothetical protein
MRGARHGTRIRDVVEKGICSPIIHALVAVLGLAACGARQTDDVTPIASESGDATDSQPLSSASPDGASSDVTPMAGDAADAQPVSSGPPDGTSTTDASFPCGNAICEPSQVCLLTTPCYGTALPDSGVCPPGYVGSGSGCEGPPPTATCVPSDLAFAEGRIDCGGPPCTPLSGPNIPLGCSRICTVICG